MQGSLMKGWLEAAVRNDSIICKKGIYDRVKNILHLGWRPLRVWGTMLQPVKPIGKSGTVCIATFYCFTLVLLETIRP